LDKLEFEEMISKLGIFMTTQELTAVYNQFDHNRDGKIAYDEFVNTVKVLYFTFLNCMHSLI
jgi:Ca2+-binding EF-hand superfamily protein